jgi:3-oxoacyl-(acyl-carrier-protein) synthase
MSAGTARLDAGVAGVGWVTPLGGDLQSVWNALSAGVVAECRPIENPETGRVHQVRPVPPKLVEHLARQPRLRRSSPISYFAVAAALAALADAGLTINADVASRTSLVFAVSNGGVIYTRRFYDQIVKQGANAASPMLFPETVYNAPASHLAAALGLDGASYTLVGDNSVGLAALHFGAQLLAIGSCEHVLVVGCEEIDWILCEAFHDWRLARTPLAEGAGAVVLTPNAQRRVATGPGVPFFCRKKASAALSTALGDHRGDLIVSSTNSTFADRAEREVLGDGGKWLFPKRHLGKRRERALSGRSLQASWRFGIGPRRPCSSL